MEKLRRAAYNDFYVFTKAVLGYNLLEPSPHREICNLFTEEPNMLEWLKMSKAERAAKAQEHGNIKKLLMLPRGTFKSTISSTSFPLWAHWHDPNLRIMIDSESFKNSKKFVSIIRDHVTNNDLLKAVATDREGGFFLAPNEKIPGGLTEDSIILKNKTVPSREPSLFCSGVDSAVTGLHPDIIIMDDIVSEKNVTTADQIEKVKQHYRYAYSLLEPGGILIIIGTRYHMNDLYNDIMDDDSFQTVVRPAVDEHGNYFFPSRLGQKRLDELKRSQGIYIFNSQYMLNPLSADNAVFKPQDICFYDGQIAGNYNTYITVDLAISQKTTADYTVIAVSSVDTENNIYVREMVRGRFTPNETSNWIFALADKYKKERLMKVGVEAVAWQKAMIFFLRDEMRRRGTFLPVVELKPDQDKIRRAQGFAPWVENHAFFIKEDMKELYKEMTEFPFSKHDDTVDAVTYLPQIIRKPGKGISKGVDSCYTPMNASTGY